MSNNLFSNTSSLSFYMENKKLWREFQKEKEKIEPLLKKTNRNCLYPILKEKIWDYYRLHLASHWTAEEIDLSKDIPDWSNKLNDEEKFFIKSTLAFFARSDFIINESQKKDSEEVTCIEYNFFNDDKIARENIHSITYANLLEAYIPNEEEKDFFKNSDKSIESIKFKKLWFEDYIINGTFVERVIAEAIMEGIFFSSSFCSIFWLRKRGLMPGLCDSNELISRDEGLHRDFNCYIYRSEITNKLDEEIVIKMIKEAVCLEKNFCTYSLPVKLIGMNVDLMSQYVEYVADHLSLNLIGKVIYNGINPFSDWMTAISLDNKTDFFVHRVTNYSNSNVTSSSSENKIRFDDDF